MTRVWIGITSSTELTRKECCTSSRRNCESSLNKSDRSSRQAFHVRDHAKSEAARHSTVFDELEWLLKEQLTTSPDQKLWAMIKEKIHTLTHAGKANRMAEAAEHIKRLRDLGLKGSELGEGGRVELDFL